MPLALLDQHWLAGRKILVLEPRRLAARGAAERMAKTLGERVGETVGMRARLGTKVGATTRIEVVTEGVFTRLIVDDPTLDGVGAVLFDEFHERSLDADLGLALALDAQAGLRDDLRMLVMSATLDGARVASLLGGDAPVIESEGRAFAGRNALSRPRHAPRIDEQMTEAILRALRTETGSILAFLPGQGEIRRVGGSAGAKGQRSRGRDRPALRRTDAAGAGSRGHAGTARTAQDRAGNLDRGDLADHRGRARGDRLRPRPRAALRDRMRASRGSIPCGSRAPQRTNAEAAPAARKPASAIACGTSRKRMSLPAFTEPEIARPT